MASRWEPEVDFLDPATGTSYISMVVGVMGFGSSSRSPQGDGVSGMYLDDVLFAGLSRAYRDVKPVFARLDPS